MFEIFRFKTKLSKEEIKSYYQKLNNESKNNRYGKLLENYISNNTIKIGNENYLIVVINNDKTLIYKY